MTALGAIGAALLGTASSAAGSWLGDMFGDSNAQDQYRRTSEMQNKQMIYDTLMYNNRYRMTVEDMKRAGLNPILAASGGFSVGSSPSLKVPSVAMAPAPGVESFSSSARNFASASREIDEAARTRIDTLKRVQEIELVGKQIDETVAKAANLRASENLMHWQEKKLLVEIKKARKEIKELTTRIAVNRSRVPEIKSKMRLQQSQAGKTDVEVSKIIADTKMLHKKIQEVTYGLNQLGKMAEVYDGAFGQWLTYAREVMKALGLQPVVGKVITGGKK